MVVLVPWSLVAAIPNIPLPADRKTQLLYGAAAAGAALVLMLLIVWLRRGKKPANPESNLAEDLAKLPPPGKGKRHYQLFVMSQPVRLRLVVVAPMGKKPIGKVDSVLEQVFRGLGEVAIDDHPRIRLWPPQLSSAGFAPTFFRLTKCPDRPGRASHWILLAGPARAGSTPVLIGMAVYTDAPTTAGLVTVDETQWSEILRVENA